MSPQAQALQLLQGRQLIPVISGLFPNPTSTQSDNTLSTSSSATHSTSTTSTATSSSTSSSSTASATTSAPPLIVQTIAGKTLTLTSFAGGQTPTINPSPSPTTTTFLQNKVLSGVVFGLAGLLGLVLIIATATCVIRRRRNKKLMEDAVKFDPTGISYYE